MSKDKLTWNDVREGVAVAKHYKWNNRETERQLRKHLAGANAEERRKVYQEFYSRKG